MRVYVVWENYNDKYKWIRNIYLTKKSAEKYVESQAHSQFHIEEYKVLA